MKYFFLITSLLISFTFNVNANSYDNQKIVEDEENYAISLSQDEIEKLPNITVYKVLGTHATSSFNAKYSANENCIYVYERKSGRSIWFSYTIYDNRAYGQDNDGRGSFRYVAGDYYFNL